MYVRALRMCKPNHGPYARRWKADKFYQNSAIAISVYLFTGGEATRKHWHCFNLRIRWNFLYTIANFENEKALFKMWFYGILYMTLTKLFGWSTWLASQQYSKHVGFCYF